MTGAELATFVQRRLAEQGLTVEADRSAELYDYITAGRDALLLAFATSAPIVAKSIVTLEEDPANDRKHSFPAATKDPYRVLAVTDSGDTGTELELSSALNQDDGQYVWRTPRELRLSENAGVVGPIEVEVVLHQAPITAATTEADVGLPTTCHRAIGYYAAVLALTADEESDATNAMGLFQRELGQLEAVYGDYDAGAGIALRHALMRSIGHQYGDTLL